MTATMALMISQGVAYGLLGLCLGLWILRKDHRLDQLQEMAVDAIPRLSKGNHTVLVDMCKFGAVGDLPAFVAEVVRGFKTITDAEKADIYFANVLDGELGLALETKERALVIKAKVDKAVAAFA